MTKEDIKKYLQLEEEIASWCEKAVGILSKYKWTENNKTVRLCYPTYTGYELYETLVLITTVYTYRGEDDYRSIGIPIDVMINNTIEDYAKDLYNNKEKYL